MLRLLALCGIASLVASQCDDTYPADSEAMAVNELPFYTNFETNTTEGFSTTNNQDPNGCSSWLKLETADDFKRSGVQSCYSGTNCWATGSMSYNDNEDSALVLPRFNFTALTKQPYLTFWIWHSTIAFRDGLIVEMSSDDGSTWTAVGSAADPQWYGSTAVVSGQSVDAFSGILPGWRLVTHALPGAQGQASVLVRLRFHATGVAPASNAGVLIDDIAVQRSAFPACPEVTFPAPNAVLRPLPTLIKWNGAAGVPYHSIRFARASQYFQAPAIGAGISSQWETPAVFEDTYTYSVHSRRADGTMNFWCEQRTFTAAVQGLVKNFPYTASFAGSMSGWSNVEYDTGRFVSSTEDGRQVMKSAGYTPLSFYVLESPPFDMTNLPAGILRVDLKWSFPSGSGATIQWSQDRGQSWNSLGAPNAGKDWYNSPDVTAFKSFLGPVRTPGWSGSRATFTKAEFNVNSGTMGFDWVPCADEVYFRVAMATGTSTGAFNGLAFANFEVRPDAAAGSAADLCTGTVPEFTTISLTPAPTPVYVAPASTASTTTASTVATTTAVQITPPPTPSPTPVGQTAAPTTVGTTTVGVTDTEPVTTEPTDATQPQTTEPPEETDATDTDPLRTLPPEPSRTERTNRATENTAPTRPTTVTTEQLELTIAEPGGLSDLGIGLLVGGLILLCLLFVLLALFIKRKMDKDSAKDAQQDADEELRRGNSA